MTRPDPTSEPATGPNPAAPPTFGEVLARRLSRRELLGASAAAAALSAWPPGLSAAPGARSPRPLEFEELAAGLGPDHAVAANYRAQVLIAWGDPVRPHAPPFDPAAQSAEAQELQFGQGNDYLAFFPLPYGSKNSDRGLLFVNHEYSVARLMFPGAESGSRTRQQMEIELAAHGFSIVEVRRRGESWSVVTEGPLNRRISARSGELRMSGPAAGHRRLVTGADPSGRRVIGTINNCAGGFTPWGTALTCEENFHAYFDGEPAGAEEQNHRRYRLGRPAFRPGRFLERFRLDREPNEPNRFGWVVEVDPYDPFSAPIKRTALGRMNHEGATCVLNGDGRLVVYLGDDSQGEYVYRFVSHGRVDPNDRAANRDLLDAGTLYVARFGEDGRLHWLPLVFGSGPLTPYNGFESQADVLIETRRAADLLGATPMDRPEDIETSPHTGRVYVALTNHSRRGSEGHPAPDAANPRGPNRHGHLLELLPPGADGERDHAALAFRWEIFLLAGDPSEETHGAAYGDGVSDDGWISCPDNLEFDPFGRLWIATDGMQGKTGRADGVFGCETTGAARAVPRRLYSVPTGAELCGPCFTPDGTTLFVAVQHPGEDAGSTFEAPSTRWPDFVDGVPPRPAVVAIRRGDGGPIGG